MSNGNSNQEQPRPYVFEQINRLIDAFPRTRVTDGSMREYAAHLSRFAPDTLARAVSQAIASCKFFPSIAELVAAAENPTLQSDAGKRRRKTHDHASMCYGMDDDEITAYFLGHPGEREAIDWPYFKNLLRKREGGRFRLLREPSQLHGPSIQWQWPVGAKTWAEVREFQRGQVKPGREGPPDGS